MKIEDNGIGFDTNFKYKNGSPAGPAAHNGKHLGFLLESVLFNTLLNSHDNSYGSVQSTFNNAAKRNLFDIEIIRDNLDDVETLCCLEVKSRRSVDGSFRPTHLSKIEPQRQYLKETGVPFAIIVGQYEASVSDVVSDLAFYDKDNDVYTTPKGYDHDTVCKVSGWYKFYVYVGYGEFGGWLDLSKEEDPLAQIADITDPKYAQCPLIEIAEGLSADAGMRDLKGDSILSLQEYKKLYLPSANIDLEPKTPSPIETLEAKIAKHREIARRHHQEAEDLNGSLLKATSNQIIEAVFSEMDSVSKHFETIEKSFLGIKTNYESLTSKVNGNFNFINEVKATLKVICQKVNKFEAQTEDKIKLWVKVITRMSENVADYKKSTDADINTNKDNIDLLDDRLKELSEKVTNFECDLLLMKKSHLSNEKREHKNRELIDHLYAQLGEDQDE